MIRQLFISAIALLLIEGCGNSGNNTSQPNKEDSVQYTRLIMNLVLNNSNYTAPDFPKELDLVYSDNNYYSFKANKVLRKYYTKDAKNGFTGYKEVKDARMNLTARIHRWTCSCEISLPNTILYFSTPNNFEYAFLFTDESKIRTGDTNDKWHPTGPPSLEFQFNFLANTFKVNSVKDVKSNEHFLYLVIDSLLGLKKLTLSDTAELRREKELYHQKNIESTDCRSCAEIVDNDINSVIKDLKAGNEDVLYYYSSSQYYPGYWKFEYTTMIGRLHLKATFHKFICGKLYSE